MASEIPSSQQVFGPRYTVRSRLILNAIDNLKKSEQKITDLAAGIGSLSLEFSKRGYEVTLVERNKDAIEKSKMLIQRNRFRAYFFHTDLFEYYPKIKADIVVASEILEHVYDEKALRHIRSNIIKNGGFLVVTVPSFNKFKELPPNSIGHLRLYDKEYLERVLIKTGFKIKSVEYYGGLFLSIYIILMDKMIVKNSNKLSVHDIEKNFILSSKWFSLYRIISPTVSLFFKIDAILFKGFFKNIGIIAIAEAGD